MDRCQIAVVLPAYNESATISKAIASFHDALPDAHIYVVDNNSSDDTAKIAAETLERLGCAGRLLTEGRQGKGFAVRRAFMEIDAEAFLLVDADLTYPADRAADLIAPILDNKADMVVGNRLVSGDYARENKRPMHTFGNRLVGWLVNTLFHAKIGDVMSGYRAMNSMFVSHYPIVVDGFELETDMTLHALDKRFRILELPVEYHDRPEGSVSKLSTLSDGAKVIGTIIQILRYYRPLFFFGTAAGLCLLAALAAGAPVINDWVTSRYVYHVPLAILASALVIVSLLLFIAGLILDSIAQQQRREFERELLDR